MRLFSGLDAEVTGKNLTTPSSLDFFVDVLFGAPLVAAAMSFLPLVDS